MAFRPCRQSPAGRHFSGEDAGHDPGRRPRTQKGRHDRPTALPHPPHRPCRNRRPDRERNPRPPRPRRHGRGRAETQAGPVHLAAGTAAARAGVDHRLDQGTADACPPPGQADRRLHRLDRQEGLQHPDRRLHHPPEERGARLEHLRLGNALHAAADLVGHRAPCRRPPRLPGLPWLRAAAARVRGPPFRRHQARHPGGDRQPLQRPEPGGQLRHRGAEIHPRRARRRLRHPRPRL